MAERHSIGASFEDDASLDATIATVGDPATNARIREELRGLQRRYRWSAARARLLEAYPRPPRRTISRASTNGE